MEKKLLIIFVKNAKLGKVKTRLAKSIGDEKALEVYNQLVEITEKATQQLIVHKRVYFSEEIIEEKWQKTSKHVQKGAGLGEKMQKAFKKAFKDGFEKIILIGSDLPEISAEIIQEGFDSLDKNEVVFGPAEDGGYYLVGMKKSQPFIFENKPWSNPKLLETTLKELGKQDVSFSLLKILNDIDTFEDFKSSKIYTDA
ncbi:MAG: glycosyltransferase [Flavobacteriales bacterium]|nr:MAG: glycosyltransferase [Flavobacteriales bacterium]